MAKNFLVLVILNLLSLGSLSAQYNQKLYNKLSKEFATAKSDQQKIKYMLKLGDYHVEQSYMEGFQRSMDTAISFAKKK